MSVKLRSKKLADGRKSLYLDIYHEGERFYEFLKNHYLYEKPKGNIEKEHNRVVLEKARIIRNDKETEILKHGYNKNRKIYKEFVCYFRALAKKKNHGTWSATLNYLDRFTGGKIKFEKINKEWLAEFKNYLLKNVAINSANLYLSKVGTALNQAIEDKLIPVKPKLPSMKMQETKREYLTIDELQKMASTPCKSKEVKRAFLFSCYTGLRLSDIRALTWQQIKNNRIDYRQQKTKVFEYLDLSPTAMKLLANKSNIVSIQGHVFNLPSRAYVAIVMKDWAELAGIEKNITFHSARHTCATLALTQGVDLYTVSKILGHKDISTTQIYAKIVDEKKRAAVNSLPEVQITNN